MKVVHIALAFCLCSLSALSTAGDSEPKQSTSLTSAPNSRDTDLRMLLREVGGRMHKNFVLDPRGPQTVDLGALERKDVTYPELLSILQVYGMVVVADGGISQVVPNTDARQMASPVIVAPENIKNLDDEWVTCVVPVKNISAMQLVPILRPLMPQYGQMAALADRNAMILVDRAANVRRMVELIRILEGLPKVADVPTTKNP
jgi:general secretion pathway protein D